MYLIFRISWQSLTLRKDKTDAACQKSTSFDKENDAFHQKFTEDSKSRHEDLTSAGKSAIM